jgi:hypothetical protein
MLFMAAACSAKQSPWREEMPAYKTITVAVPDCFEPTSPFLRDKDENGCSMTGSGLGSEAGNSHGISGLSSRTFDSRLVEALAVSQIGTLYRSGGNKPAVGFDCSGFTSWVYGKLGIDLPRTSSQQFHRGKAIAKGELRRGDLVFFGSRQHITHVGIYLEDNKFIHSSSTGDTVKVSSLEGTAWAGKYSGARRMY